MLIASVNGKIHIELNTVMEVTSNFGTKRHPTARPCNSDPTIPRRTGNRFLYAHAIQLLIMATTDRLQVIPMIMFSSTPKKEVNKIWSLGNSPINRYIEAWITA